MSEEFKEKEIDEVPAAEEIPAEDTAESSAGENAAAELEAPAVEQKKEKKPDRVKAFVFGLLAVCVVVIGILGWKSIKEGGLKNVFDKSAEETVEFKTVNYEKLIKTHKADDIALSIDGKDFRWDEYFCWVYNMCEQVSSYFKQTYSYYGVMLNWGDNINEDSDKTYFDVVHDSAEELLKEIVCVEKAAEENGVELDADDEAQITEAIAVNAVSYCGEGATEEDFAEYISDLYMPLDFFKRTVAERILQEKLFVKLFGEDLSLVSDDDALAFLEENGYMYANHILFLNTDAEGNALDEAAMAEKLEQAKAVVEELRAISVKSKRVERFKELKEELCEDGGKTMYPDGYIFTSGKMVASFENASAALSDYEVSDPVESEYGYHIIIRLPLDPDGVIEYDQSTYQPVTARYMVANQSFSELLQTTYDSLTVEYKPGFETLKLAKYLTK